MLTYIAASRVDIVVVYKVDRLTRSLLDFAKLVEAFDKVGTSFVLITQSFNTTTRRFGQRSDPAIASPLCDNLFPSIPYWQIFR